VRDVSPQKGAPISSGEMPGNGHGDSDGEKQVKDEVPAEGHNGSDNDGNGTTTDEGEAKMKTGGGGASTATFKLTGDKPTTRSAVALQGKSLTSGVIRGYAYFRATSYVFLHIRRGDSRGSERCLRSFSFITSFLHAFR
jgi:hypothetical protein